MRTTVRDHAGTFFWQSKDVTLNHLDVRFLHGFGMVGQFTENVTLNDVDFETDPASGRTTAGYADFIQMSGCKGLIEISDCTFSNPHDDPINIHGTFLQVVTSARTAPRSPCSTCTTRPPDPPTTMWAIRWNSPPVATWCPCLKTGKWPCATWWRWMVPMAGAGKVASMT